MLNKYRSAWIGLICLCVVVVLAVVLGGGDQSFRSKYEGVDLTADIG